MEIEKETIHAYVSKEFVRKLNAATQLQGMKTRGDFVEKYCTIACDIIMRTHVENNADHKYTEVVEDDVSKN